MAGFYAFFDSSESLTAKAAKKSSKDRKGTSLGFDLGFLDVFSG
jgi:hypothetical protein